MSFPVPWTCSILLCSALTTPETGQLSPKEMVRPSMVNGRLEEESGKKPRIAQETMFYKEFVIGMMNLLP